MMEILEDLPTKPLTKHNLQAKWVLENDELETWVNSLMVP